jgi:hypothetical protein
MGRGQLSDRSLAARETGEHRPPRRIGKRVEGGVESFNHVVVYTPHGIIIQPIG